MVCFYNDIAEFAYDALGRRVSRITYHDSQTTRYYYNDKWQVLCEYDGNDIPKRWYAYGNYIDEVLVTNVISAPALCKYYVHDHLYSPVALVSAIGTVQERYEYDAYGACTIREPNHAPRAASLYGNNYLFTGRRLDTLDNGSLKIQLNRNRFYDPDTGRWLTKDPLGYQDGMNPYGYVGNQPISRTDLYGTRMYLISKGERNLWNLGPRGETESQLITDLKCLNERLKIYVKLRVTLRLLHKDHERWDQRLAWYDRWGNPRTNARERQACAWHEQDHRRTYTVGFWSEAQIVDSLDNQEFCNEEHCQRTLMCVLSKLYELREQSITHSRSFDGPSWNYGNAYPKHPFKGKINLSECEYCDSYGRRCRGNVCSAK